MKNKTRLFLLLILILIYFFLHPQKTISHTEYGLVLWYRLLPSLLPFFLLLHLIQCYAPSRKINALTGILGGCPGGAVNLKGLLDKKVLTSDEAQFFLYFTNNTSPSFILGYVCCILLKAPRLSLLYWWLTFSSSLISALILTRKDIVLNLFRTIGKPSGFHNKNRQLSQPASLIKNINDSITETASILIRIGGYIILFSLITGFLNETIIKAPDTSTMRSIILGGMLEITNGLQQLSISQLSTFPKTLLALCLVSFGGFSTFFQTSSILNGYTLSMKKYLLSRILQTVLTGLQFLLAFKVLL